MNRDMLQEEVRELRSRVKALEAELARAQAPFMTRKEAADFLHLNVGTIDKALGNGTLTKFMFRGKILIKREELLREVKIAGPVMLDGAVVVDFSRPRTETRTFMGNYLEEIQR